MISHLMVGTNDMDKARAFYDATLGALGIPASNPAIPVAAYRVAGAPSFIVVKPRDGEAATHANGGTIGFAATSRDHVAAWHEAGTSHGGTAIESPPGERPNGSFVAYLRDPDGHKITARSQPTK